MEIIVEAQDVWMPEERRHYILKNELEHVCGSHGQGPYF